MNIFTVGNFANCNKAFNLQRKNTPVLSSLRQDTVSFGAKNNKDNSPRILKAVQFAKELIALRNQDCLNIDNIQTILDEVSPIPTKIKSIEERPKETSFIKASAYMHPICNEDMEIEKAIIYVNTEDIINNPAQIISTLAHEFTHIIQRYEQNDYMGLKKIANNLEEARLLNFIQNVASQNLQSSYLKQSAQEKWFRFYSPVKDSEQTSVNIAKLLPDNQTLKKQANDECNLAVKKIIADLKASDDVNEIDIERILELKQGVKKAMVRHFEMETEAEKVGIKVAKMQPDYESYMLFARCGIMRVHEKFAQALNG